MGLQVHRQVGSLRKVLHTLHLSVYDKVLRRPVEATGAKRTLINLVVMSVTRTSNAQAQSDTSAIAIGVTLDQAGRTKYAHRGSVERRSKDGSRSAEEMQDQREQN